MKKINILSFIAVCFVSFYAKPARLARSSLRILNTRSMQRTFTSLRSQIALGNSSRQNLFSVTKRNFQSLEKDVNDSQILRELISQNIKKISKIRPYPDPNQSRKDLFKYLLEEGYTPLYIACEYNNLEMVDELLKKRVDPNEYVDDAGVCQSTPLHVAVRVASTSIIKKLLLNPETKITAQTRKSERDMFTGYSILHFAVYRDFETLQFIMNTIKEKLSAQEFEYFIRLKNNSDITAYKLAEIESTRVGEWSDKEISEFRDKATIIESYLD